MSLEYTKRLLELREYTMGILTEQITEENNVDSLVNKPKNKVEEEKENPLDKIQKSAFLEVVMSNLELKEQVDDSV